MPVWLDWYDVLRIAVIVCGCFFFGALITLVLDPQIDPQGAIRRWWRSRQAKKAAQRTARIQAEWNPRGEVWRRARQRRA